MHSYILLIPDVQFGDKVYHRLVDADQYKRTTFGEAVNYCKSIKGRVVEILSKEEDEYIEEIMDYGSF